MRRSTSADRGTILAPISFSLFSRRPSLRRLTHSPGSAGCSASFWGRHASSLTSHFLASMLRVTSLKEWSCLCLVLWRCEVSLSIPAAEGSLAFFWETPCFAWAGGKRTHADGHADTACPAEGLGSWSEAASDLWQSLQPATKRRGASRNGVTNVASGGYNEGDGRIAALSHGRFRYLRREVRARCRELEQSSAAHRQGHCYFSVCIFPLLFLFFLLGSWCSVVRDLVVPVCYRWSCERRCRRCSCGRSHVDVAPSGRTLPSETDLGQPPLIPRMRHCIRT